MNLQTELFSGIDASTVKSKIDSSRLILITAHKSPDGDAAGSSLGLYDVLKNYGKNVHVVFPDPFPAFFDWMKGSSECLFYSKQKTEVNELFQKADLVFCLDYNEFSRTGEMEQTLKNSSAFKIMIDHHPEPSGQADMLISSTRECATAQMVYQFVVFLDLKKYLSSEGASCLYCGIMTDTGSFRHAGTTAKTHLIISELIGAGADNTAVHATVFDNDSESRLRLFGYALSEKMTVLYEHKTTYFVLTAEELERFRYQPGDTEGLVNYGLAIKGILMSAIFIERKEVIKVSFRSKGSLPVNEFSKKYFNGGGHKNAAGGSAYCNLSEAVSLFLGNLPAFIDEHEN